MNVARSLWSNATGSPTFMRRVNGWAAVIWVVMIPVSWKLGWLHSVTYVSALSLWALVSGHWSAWQSARVEERQDEQEQAERERPVEERVVEKIVERTTVDRS